MFITSTECTSLCRRKSPVPPAVSGLFLVDIRPEISPKPRVVRGLGGGCGAAQAAEPIDVDGVVLRRETLRACKVIDSCVERMLEPLAQGDVLHGSATLADEVMVVTREVLCQLVEGMVGAVHEASDDADLLQHSEIPVGRTLRE